ncbi:hypothetical protein ACFWJM_05565 [Streptomyces sp. NPDC127077]|uniref:hypothetical protein n=1 Tax=Streptomyces sp. NPDC127077 TaxID=3347131 RepID=UPI00364C734D
MQQAGRRHGHWSFTRCVGTLLAIAATAHLQARDLDHTLGDHSADDQSLLPRRSQKALDRPEWAIVR